MILKALTLENFKGIREPVRIEFAPLTMLFGPNNAGKSTVIQALIYAREILERGNSDPRRTEMGGDVLDLGGFANLVHGHDRRRTIRMRFEIDVQGQELRKQAKLPDGLLMDRGDRIWSDGPTDTLIAAYFDHRTFDLDELPTIDGILVHLRPAWLELAVEWSDQYGRSIVMHLQVGALGATKPSLAIEFNQMEHSAHLVSFNLGEIPIGKQDTAASQAVWPGPPISDEDLESLYHPDKNVQPAGWDEPPLSQTGDRLSGPGWEAIQKSRLVSAQRAEAAKNASSEASRLRKQLWISSEALLTSLLSDRWLPNESGVLRMRLKGLTSALPGVLDRLEFDGDP